MSSITETIAIEDLSTDASYVNKLTRCIAVCHLQKNNQCRRMRLLHGVPYIRVKSGTYTNDCK